MPCPPPMHMVTRAYCPPIRCSSCGALTVTMAPVAPNGWPNEIPLPFLDSSSRVEDQVRAGPQAPGPRTLHSPRIHRSAPRSTRCGEALWCTAEMGPDAHECRFHAGYRVVDQSGKRLEVALFRSMPFHQHHGGGAVIQCSRHYRRSLYPLGRKLASVWPGPRCLRAALGDSSVVN